MPHFSIKDSVSRQPCLPDPSVPRSPTKLQALTGIPAPQLGDATTHDQVLPRLQAPLVRDGELTDGHRVDDDGRRMGRCGTGGRRGGGGGEGGHIRVRWEVDNLLVAGEHGVWEGGKGSKAGRLEKVQLQTLTKHLPLPQTHLCGRCWETPVHHDQEAASTRGLGLRRSRGGLIRELDGKPAVGPALHGWVATGRDDDDLRELGLMGVGVKGPNVKLDEAQ